MKQHFEQALSNVIQHGDTDVFPFPFERLLFQEKFTDVVKVLENINRDIEKALSERPPLNLVKLSQVGYYGFRQVTLLEPFWNAYLLALVISLADKIEKKRISETQNKVFSYRFQWDANKSSLFKNTTWIDYKKQCVELSKSYKIVLQTDISNFYSRVNHHRLENELKRVDEISDVPWKIMKLLGVFSGTISHGLPVGGPAARILAELSLNNTDYQLNMRGVIFCRYADDYTIFCNNESEAYKVLILLSEKLAIDQLGLQKDKTKIMSAEEYREIHLFLDPQADAEIFSQEQKLLNISIRYDPYSATAVEDYDTLKEAVKEIDLIAILSKEVNKTKIDQTVTKQAINAIRVLSVYDQLQAVKVLLDPDNLNTLSPVFVTIMRVLRSIYNDFNKLGQDLVDKALLDLFRTESYLTKIELNLNYIVQILSLRRSHEKEELFIQLFESETDHFLKRQIIISMANWNCHYWLSDIKNRFTFMSTWERRAFIYASFFLGDEGKHWRSHVRNLFTIEETIIRDWCGERFINKNKILV